MEYTFVVVFFFFVDVSKLLLLRKIAALTWEQPGKCTCLGCVTEELAECM